MAKDKKDPDPFPHLPRRSFYAMEPPDGIRDWLIKRDIEDAGFPVGPIEPPAPIPAPLKAEKIAALKQIVAETIPKKRGRPKAEGPKPWEAEGVTQRTWYRRRKERGE